MRCVENFTAVKLMSCVGGFGDARFALSTVGDDEMPRLGVGRGRRVL